MMGPHHEPAPPLPYFQVSMLVDSGKPMGSSDTELLNLLHKVPYLSYGVGRACISSSLMPC